MGAIISGIGIAAVANTLDTVLLRQGRSIAGIIPDCTIEERHKDDLEITQSPVEQGTPIADHAYKKPAELVMRVAWSDSKRLGELVASALTGSLGSVKDVYQQLLTLQQTLEPFSVVTGKRSYEHMMLKSLQVITNKEAENILMVEAIFQEVLIVSTQIVSASSLGLVQHQANPQSTAAPASTGSLQLGSPNASPIITGLQ